MNFLPGPETWFGTGQRRADDGFAFLSPVDHYGEKGRNGFGLADMCGGVWEFVLDDFDPVGHEELHYRNEEPQSRW
ncbi:MAG: SUMF1/EgtB/PvdO family nonheme iron enzyme [Pirellulaceae bacterium]